LIVAEDAHWMDRSSTDVLAFIARRLDSDPIVLLIATRGGTESALDKAGLPELRLEGLGEAATPRGLAHASQSRSC
jgi:predicted ATPase